MSESADPAGAGAGDEAEATPADGVTYVQLPTSNATQHTPRPWTRAAAVPDLMGTALRPLHAALLQHTPLGRDVLRIACQYAFTVTLHCSAPALEGVEHPMERSWYSNAGVIPAHARVVGLSVDVRFKDQGWGNRKGEVFVRLLRRAPVPETAADAKASDGATATAAAAVAPADNECDNTERDACDDDCDEGYDDDYAWNRRVWGPKRQGIPGTGDVVTYAVAGDADAYGATRADFTPSPQFPLATALAYARGIIPVAEHDWTTHHWELTAPATDDADVDPRAAVDTAADTTAAAGSAGAAASAAAAAATAPAAEVDGVPNARILSLARPGDQYQLWKSVGGGGGHALFVSRCVVTITLALDAHTDVNAIVAHALPSVAAAAAPAAAASC